MQDLNQLREFTAIGYDSEINKPGFEHMFSYFFITGYLISCKEATNKYRLPNRELIHEFSEKIMTYYETIFKIDPNIFSALTSTLSAVFESNSPDHIAQVFRSKFAPGFAALRKDVRLFTSSNVDAKDRELFANEDFVHSLLNFTAFQIVSSNFAAERYTKKKWFNRHSRYSMLKRMGLASLLE